MTTDRYTQQPVAGAGYFGLFDGDHELSDQDAIARLNAQAREINDLREALDTAHQHIGALLTNTEDDVARYATLDAARAWLRRAS